MPKGSKNTNIGKSADKDKNHGKNHASKPGLKNKDYLISMSHAPGLQETTNWFQMIPALLFTTAVILIVRMTPYVRPMSDFFWSTDKNQLTDFFSYYKMAAILFCASLAIVILLYRVFIQAFYIKRSFAYIPMIVYSVFVFLSYLFSDYKLFSLWGFNDRFEGTMALLGYMVMLFYIINSVNTEKNVKWIIYALASVGSLLGLLGISQALGHDFFKTIIGKKLITPSWFWDQLDTLDFTFTNQIYQTVYNINYVSFYLTLLIPIFGLLFIRSVMLGREESLYRKLGWGALFSLLLFNLIGSASSSGLLGMTVVVLVAIVVLNKRILSWWKPVAALLLIVIVVGGLSIQRWLPELTESMGSINGGLTSQRTAENNIRHKIDSLITKDDQIIMGYEGEKIIFQTYPDDPSSISIIDSKGEALALKPEADNSSVFRLQDERYKWITVQPGTDDKEHHYIVIATDGHDWPFRLTNEGPKYYTAIHKLVDLREVPAVGWENNQSFGTGRGYIWSRTIPMIKDTVLLGHGADTYSIYFPQDDFVGKYNSGSFSSNINIIVDKPHSLYFGYMIGTGVISMLALLVLWFSYIIQSYLLYRRNLNNDFITFSGLGIFLGICGFLVAAGFNDSNVSVTPMFYGLLGTGIAINMILKNNAEKHME